jgi:integrase
MVCDMSRIRNLVFDGGERYPILLDSSGIPDYWVTLYVTVKLRPSLTQSAITNAIGHLQHFKLWEDANNRDVVDSFSKSDFLTDRDIYSLRDHCLLSSRCVKKWNEGSASKVVRFAAASTASIDSMQTVSSNHASNRISHIAEFLDFTARILLKRRLSQSSVSKSLEKMKSSLIASKPRGRSSRGLSSDPNSKSAPPEAFERVMEITREDSEENPFKSDEIRFRNAVIFDVMNATGMRSGEILALQVGDIDFYEKTISVVRRHDAKEDSRKKQPVAKTRERRIPVSDCIIKRLRTYVMEWRANIEAARKHPYLFVTHKRGKYHGHPISNSTFTNRVLRTATAVNPELLNEVTRHGFRHHFNSLLSR